MDTSNNDFGREIDRCRKEQKKRISNLHPFREGYTVEKLLKDLDTYFEGEVDFDLGKVRDLAQKKGMLDKLIKSAIEKNTHPVCEFIEEIFKDSVDES